VPKVLLPVFTQLGGSSRRRSSGRCRWQSAGGGRLRDSDPVRIGTASFSNGDPAVSLQARQRGNLLSAQAMARAREMALRVSIGAGSGRLIQMVLVESVLRRVLRVRPWRASLWWSAPLVVSMLASPENPVRLVLDADLRAVAFGVALTVVVALGFDSARASRLVREACERNSRAGKTRSPAEALMNSLIAFQMALCVLVLSWRDSSSPHSSGSRTAAWILARACSCFEHRDRQETTAGFLDAGSRPSAPDSGSGIGRGCGVDVVERQ